VSMIPVTMLSMPITTKSGSNMAADADQLQSRDADSINRSL